MIPALEAAIAHFTDHPDGARPAPLHARATERPPLQPLAAAQAQALRRSLPANGFSMSRLRAGQVVS